MSHYRYRRQVRFRWRGAALTIVLVAILALPVSGLVSVLLGVAHTVDLAVRPLGWQATYALIAVAWLVRALFSAEVTVDG